MTPQELMKRINQLEEEVQILVAKFQADTKTRVESLTVKSVSSTEFCADPRPTYIPEEVIALVEI